VRQSIRGYTDGLIALAAPTGESSLTTLAAESSAVRGVIDASEELRRALSDPGIPLAARRDVLRDLFGSHIGTASMRLVDFVLESDRASDTVEDIEWVAERLDAGRESLAPVGDVVLGTKGAEERIEGFATAVLQTAGERALGEIEDELFRFARVVAGSEELRAVLSNRDYPPAVRRGVVSDLLQGKATPATVSMATYATQVGRPRDFEELLEVLINRVASESNRRLADVRSAVAMDEQQERKLAAALSRAVGRDVEIRVTVDPSVVAGFVATIGDTVVDGSARHQLELLKERLVSPEAQATTRHTTTEERH
jgi:F-type H+-transporting ATPase subunit delta